MDLLMQRKVWDLFREREGKMQQLACPVRGEVQALLRELEEQMLKVFLRSRNNPENPGKWPGW